MTKITREIAEKVAEVVSHGLSYGLGDPEPGKFCVEAAVCYALGEPHGDSPSCVHPVIRAFKICLNDSLLWSDRKARASGMARIAIAQLGSTEIDPKKWVDYVYEQTIKRIVPISLRILAQKLPLYEDALNESADLCEKHGDKETAEKTHQILLKASEELRNLSTLRLTNAMEIALNSDKHGLWRHTLPAYIANQVAMFPINSNAILSLSAEIAVEACILCETEGSKFLDVVK